MPEKALYKKATEPSRISPQAGKIRKERLDCLMVISYELWNAVRCIYYSRPILINVTKNKWFSPRLFVMRWVLPSGRAFNVIEVFMNHATIKPIRILIPVSRFQFRKP